MANLPTADQEEPPNLTFEQAASALLTAASRGDKTACERALRRHPEALEALDKDDRTALLLASAAGHLEVCEILLSIRADVEATDRFGKTPLSYAAAASHTEICRLLLDHGAEIEATDCIVRDYGMSCNIA
eukprot:TRINITY_DN12650_c0_g5_i1.p1 TRINITY_DN12650_c0_g5~~TRINITY_DN12650_c0_g5_i1.p1  ORF type:complete len:142 (+),score=17.71 TRINITY_DN12650_c0_g5_i1:35-427(+)